MVPLVVGTLHCTAALEFPLQLLLTVSELRIKIEFGI